MADTPAPGETATPGDIKNDVSTASAPATTPDNAGLAEVERLRKEAEQARMRANQLQNELEARNRQEEEARQKQLEEQQEYKQLFEQSNAELKRLREEQEAQAKRQELNKQTQEVFKDYPEAVIKAAQTAGLSLTDDSEIARTSLRSKLDDLKAIVAPTATTTAPATSANPAATATTPAPAPEGPLGKPKSLGIDNGSVAVNPDGNTKKARDYIGNLETVKAMKLLSGFYQEQK